MKVTVDTGPPGDHEPDVFNDVQAIVIIDHRRALVLQSYDDEHIASYEGDDWTTVTIDQSMDEI